MHIRRTLLALLVALSVAIMPTAGAVAMSASPAEAGSATMPDCDGADMPCENSMKGCPLMALCASTSVGLAGTSFSAFNFPVAADDNKPSLASFGLDSQPSSPPFRPPRI